MAGTIRKKKLSVNERLVREPHQFTFFQAVRLLTAAASARHSGDLHSRGGTLGSSAAMDAEPVRFKTRPGLNFAPTEIVALRQPAPDGDDEAETRRPELEIAFWGLTGPAGALPSHYTQQVIDRVHVKDHAMHDFFDLFSHRLLSFFYRAWEKYFLAAGFESSIENDPKSDLIRESLLSLVGRGTDAVRDRLEAADDALIYYGGLFVERPTAESLRAMVADFLGLPAKVLSLFGQWLVLPYPERTRMGVLDGHCQLGFDTIVGERTWDPSSKFRVQVGPVTWNQFESLMPTGDALVRTCQLIRSYVGLELEFDLQVLLLAEEIPMCRFVSHETESQSAAPYLGWNTWLCSEQPEMDSEDAVFYHDGSPSR
ncbi:MAG: type VI secretion system baseplate subunit TssG [Planctomycetota bacterium]